MIYTSTVFSTKKQRSKPFRALCELTPCEGETVSFEFFDNVDETYLQDIISQTKNYIPKGRSNTTCIKQ